MDAPGSRRAEAREGNTQKGRRLREVHNELSRPREVVLSVGTSRDDVYQGGGSELETGWKDPGQGWHWKSRRETGRDAQGEWHAKTRTLQETSL